MTDEKADENMKVHNDPSPATHTVSEGGELLLGHSRLKDEDITENDIGYRRGLTTTCTSNCISKRRSTSILWPACQGVPPLGSRYNVQKLDRIFAKLAPCQRG